MKYPILAAMFFSLSAFAQLGPAGTPSGTGAGSGVGSFSTDVSSFNTGTFNSPDNGTLPATINGGGQGINLQKLNPSPNPTPDLNNTDAFNNSTTVDPDRERQAQELGPREQTPALVPSQPSGTGMQGVTH